MPWACGARQPPRRGCARAEVCGSIALSGHLGGGPPGEAPSRALRAALRAAVRRALAEALAPAASGLQVSVFPPEVDVGLAGSNGRLATLNFMFEIAFPDPHDLGPVREVLNLEVAYGGAVRVLPALAREAPLGFSQLSLHLQVLDR
ncbi:unnamed protein product [Prorocentrum cordatum]|uniref:SMP-LTD domain-containing protein n=1 Tax=Prorocentrum cordatum TaxID=2364126 RepID=A0ABN9U3K5_9DINO|nr:unnamed protein product [Polarella glacialis]